VLPRGKTVKPPTKLPIENLTEEPYASIFCYPQAKPLEVENRILELKEMGIEVVEFTGDGSAASVPVIGKGYVGIVVIAYTKRGERLALKMRRLDGGRDDFFHEANMLQKANNINVGPKFVAVTKNFLLSQFIDGKFLAEWLQTHKEKTAFRNVLLDILEQCWRLDEVGLDHGELSKAPRHLLMDKTSKPFIVDFETASIQRKVANVTSVCQYLFVGNGIVPRLVWEVLGEKDINQIVEVLRSYKRDRNRACFETLLQICL
jgi:putative serine/threonine protein kinase